MSNEFKAAVELMARASTIWMNGARQHPDPDWEALPAIVRNAYREQATAALRALITQGWSASRWMPLEGVPRDRSTYVVASFPKGFVGTAQRGAINRNEFTNMKGDYFAPTHYLLLPSAPVAGADDGR